MDDLLQMAKGLAATVRAALHNGIPDIEHLDAYHATMECLHALLTPIPAVWDTWRTMFMARYDGGPTGGGEAA